MGLVSRYVTHMSLRHDEACYLNRQMRRLERQGNSDRGVPTFGQRGAARIRDVGKRRALVLVCGDMI